MKETKTQNPKSLTMNDLVEIIYETATGCYGVVGICDKDIGNKKATSLEKEKAKKGIQIVGSLEKGFSVSIFVILSSEVKISESIRECQKSIKYVANKKTGHKCSKVNVYAMAII